MISILGILKSRLYGSGELKWQVENKQQKKQVKQVAAAGLRKK